MIRVQESRGSAWFAVVPVALVAIGAAVVFFMQEKTLSNVTARHPPLLFDVNGDGTEDALFTALSVGTPNVHVRALDANTGETLWKSDDLEGGSENLGLVGDAVLSFTASKFRGFDARSGKPRFVQDLPERVKALCEEQGRWFLLAEDDKLYALDPASGSLTPSAPAGVLRSTPGSPACTPAWYSKYQDFGRLIRADSSTNVRVDGMSVSTVLYFGDAALPGLALGARTQGSRIPMLAGERDGQVAWKLELPGSAPLEVETGDPTAATIAAGRAYASYERLESKGFTVVGVSLANGQRLWETHVPRKRNPSTMRMHAGERHVFAVADYSLYALAASDGRLLWRIGWDPGS